MTQATKRPHPPTAVQSTPRPLKPSSTVRSQSDPTAHIQTHDKILDPRLPKPTNQRSSSPTAHYINPLASPVSSPIFFFSDAPKMAAADAAPAATKAKKAAPRKPRVPGTHPPYLEMVTEAIAALKERTGSSTYAIAKFIEDKQKNLPPNFKKVLFIQIKKFVAGGKLVKVKNSFKLPSKSTAAAAPAKPAAAAKKPKTVTKPKPVAKPKKPAAAAAKKTKAAVAKPKKAAAKPKPRPAAAKPAKKAAKAKATPTKKRAAPATKKTPVKKPAAKKVKK